MHSNALECDPMEGPWPEHFVVEPKRVSHKHMFGLVIGLILVDSTLDANASQLF